MATDPTDAMRRAQQQLRSGGSGDGTGCVVLFVLLGLLAALPLAVILAGQIRVGPEHFSLPPITGPDVSTEHHSCRRGQSREPD